MDSCRINKWYLTHTDDAHLGATTLMTKGTHNLLKTVTSTKEIWAVDLVHLYTLWNGKVLKVAQLEVTLLFFGVNLIADYLHIGSFSHTTHEEQTSADQTYLDSDGEVENHRQQESYPKHDDIAFRILQNAEERTPATHVIAYNHQYTSQTSHWDKLGKWHEEQEDQQEHSCVDNTSYRRTTTIIYIGHGAGDGTSSRNTAKDRTRQIGHTLGNQLGI